MGWSNASNPTYRVQDGTQSALEALLTFERHHTCHAALNPWTPIAIPCARGAGRRPSPGERAERACPNPPEEVLHGQVHTPQNPLGTFRSRTLRPEHRPWMGPGSPCQACKTGACAPVALADVQLRLDLLRSRVSHRRTPDLRTKGRGVDRRLLQGPGGAELLPAERHEDGGYGIYGSAS